MKKKGFTLAEVLITLGIIGTVAAMTMPGLVGNYQKKIRVTQLKKAYITWNNAFRLMLAGDGVNYLSDTAFATAVTDSGKNLYNAASSYPEAHTILMKYFKTTKMVTSPSVGDACNYKTMDGSGPYGLSCDFIKLYLVDGTNYRIWLNDLDKDTDTNTHGHVFIDVNGDNKPNVMGRDIFEFIVDRTGTLIPTHSLVYNERWCGVGCVNHWKQQKVFCGTEGSADITDVGGLGCAARIMESGWEMDY
ncbi:MAG: type II secretion system GspH family protein [Heliobacteriaceae bacterium]|jgi:prepilin-type N-terminal cleavage/methylation domain-containing protein|nr:type II secretion system GspH family protein [Heliobacteriaceae bacterium]